MTRRRRSLFSEVVNQMHAVAYLVHEQRQDAVGSENSQHLFFGCKGCLSGFCPCPSDHRLAVASNFWTAAGFPSLNLKPSKPIQSEAALKPALDWSNARRAGGHALAWEKIQGHGLHYGHSLSLADVPGLVDQIESWLDRGKPHKD